MALASATSSVVNSSCPYVQLDVSLSSSAGASATYAWTLKYVTPTSSTMHTSYTKTVTAKVGSTTVYSAAVTVGYKTSYTISSGTVTLSKTTSAQTITISVSIAWGSATWSSTTLGTRSGTDTFTLAAKTSYIASYDANGGSGAPSSQTKWYGTTLTLSTTVPTRAGYSFKGWGTSASATTVTYAAGASYTANSAITLYAVWSLDYIAPSIAVSKAFRVADGESTTENAGGEYVYATMDWSVDTTYTDGNTGTASISYKASTADSYTALDAEGTTSGESGTCHAWFEADGATIFSVQFSITDAAGQSSSTVTKTATVAGTSIPFEVANQGQGVGILAHAPDVGVSIGGDVTVDGDVTAGDASLKELWDTES